MAAYLLVVVKKEGHSGIVLHSWANIYQFQDMSLIYICSDFNSRCGDNDDFIAGVDNVCERRVVDFYTNYHGNVLLEF